MNIAQMGIFLSAMHVYWTRMHTNATDCRITIPAKRGPTTGPTILAHGSMSNDSRPATQPDQAVSFAREHFFSDAIATQQHRLPVYEAKNP